MQTYQATVYCRFCNFHRVSPQFLPKTERQLRNTALRNPIQIDVPVGYTVWEIPCPVCGQHQLRLKEDEQ